MPSFELPVIQEVDSTGELTFELDPLTRYNLKIYVNNAEVDCTVTLYDQKGQQLAPFTLLAAAELILTRVNYNKIVFSDASSYAIYAVIQKVIYENPQEMNCVIPDISISAFQTGLAKTSQLPSALDINGNLNTNAQATISGDTVGLAKSTQLPNALSAGGQLVMQLANDAVGLFKPGNNVGTFAQSPITLATDSVGLFKSGQTIGQSPITLQTDNVGVFKAGQNVGTFAQSPITLATDSVGLAKTGQLPAALDASGLLKSGLWQGANQALINASGYLSHILQTDNVGLFKAGQAIGTFAQSPITLQTDNVGVFKTGQNIGTFAQSPITLATDSVGLAKTGQLPAALDASGLLKSGLWQGANQALINASGYLSHILQTDNVGLFKAGQAIGTFAQSPITLQTDNVGVFKTGQNIGTFAQSPITLATDSVGLAKTGQLPAALDASGLLKSGLWQGANQALINASGYLSHILQTDNVGLFKAGQAIGTFAQSPITLAADSVGLFKQNQNIGGIVSAITARSTTAAGYQESVLYLNNSSIGIFLSGSSSDSSANYKVGLGSATFTLTFSLPQATAATFSGQFLVKLALYTDTTAIITLVSGSTTFTAKGTTAGTIATYALASNWTTGNNADNIDQFVTIFAKTSSPVTLNAGDTLEIVIVLDISSNNGAANTWLDCLNGVSYVVLPLV